MIDPTKIDYASVAHVAQEGSPLLLQAIGRLYGLGPNERLALGADGRGFPTWAWVTLALGVGLVAGVRIQKRYPQHVPKIVSGGARR